MVWKTREEIVAAFANEPEQAADVVMALQVQVEGVARWQVQVEQLQLRIRELERRFSQNCSFSLKSHPLSQ